LKHKHTLHFRFAFLDSPNLPKMSHNLVPVGEPLALFPEFIARGPETLIMKEQVMSIGDDAFHVKTAAGATVLTISADALSLSRRKRVFAPDGTHLFTIRHHLISIPSSYYVENPAGERIFEIKGKLHLLTSKAEGIFKNAVAGGREEKLLMEGSFFNRHTKITNERDGAVVAEIDRDMINLRQILADRQTYAVHVAPGIDIALIVAMVICLDERRDAKTNDGGI